MVSVICPVFNEEKFIEKCMASVLAQDYPTENMEVFFVDGSSTDNTRSMIEKYTREHDYIHLLHNEFREVSFALNKGIEAARGEVIIRIDGHCTYPENYISTLVRYLFELDADNVGGLWKTLPANDSAVCHGIAIASSHPFGVGASRHKIGSKNIIKTDTVPFGCYRRDVFDRIGLFDTDLTRNQDDEFNGRLIKNGGKIYLIPDLVINYTARNRVAKMRKMYYQYGLYKPLVNKKLGSPATVRQFFPLLFLLGIVVGAILSFVSQWIFYLYVAVLLLYLGIGISIGIANMRKKRKISLLFWMPYIFTNIHLSYGYGYLVGIMKLLTNGTYQVNSNR